MRGTLVGVAGWVLAGVALLAGASGPNEVRTRRLVVEDARGRAFFVVEDADGVCGMTVTDPNGGKARVGLSVNARGYPVLKVVYRDGEAEQVATRLPVVRP